MELLTVAQLRGFIPDAAQDDDTLQMILDGSQDVLDEWAGPLTEGDYGEALEVTETIYGAGSSILTLHQQVLSVVSVTNTVDDIETELTADGYRFRRDQLTRYQAFGTSSADPLPYSWGDKTVVVYVPKGSANTRRMALVKLVQLELGVTQQGAGPWQEGYGGVDYLGTRQDILESVRQGPAFA
jgi:hypothetical protein